MPIIDYEDHPEKLGKPIVPEVHSKNYSSTLIETDFRLRSNIITQIDGSPWKVDYYSQVLTKDAPLKGLSAGTDALNQSYIKVKDFILRVTSALATSQERENNSMVVIGSSNVYPFLLPNQGDMFVADIGEGRTGIFRVTNVESRSIYKESTHVIDYQLVDYADSGERSVDLEEKVVETRHFVYEFMDYNQNPFVGDDDYNRLQRIKERYPEMLNVMLRLCISQELKCFLVPSQPKLTYDYWHTVFMKRAFDMVSSKRMLSVKTFNVNDDPWMKTATIWDALYDRDADLMHYIMTRTIQVPADYFTRNPVFEGIHWSGVELVLYPLDPQTDGDTGCQCEVKCKTVVMLEKSCDMRGIDNHNGVPLIKRVGTDNYYVLSEDFYKETIHQSVLESLTWMYLRNKPVDQHALDALINSWHDWGRLEKFYYTPILLLLMHSVMRGI